MMSATLLIASSKSSKVCGEEGKKGGGWRASRVSNESFSVIVMASDNYFRTYIMDSINYGFEKREWY